MTTEIVSDSAALVARQMKHLKRVPETLVAITLMPLSLVIVFGYLFGSSMTVPGGEYHDYIMAGIFAMVMVSAVTNTAVGVAGDLHNGLVDRFRSLPMAQVSVLIGRTVADLILNSISCVGMMLIGFLIGWRINAGLLPALGGFLLLLLLGLAMTWVGALIGLAVRNQEAVSSISVFVVFPMMFLSAAYFPLSNLPGWLEAVAAWNPVSSVVTAIRELWGNPTGIGSDPSLPLRYPVIVSLITVSLLMVVIVPAASRMYRRAAAR